MEELLEKLGLPKDASWSEVKRVYLEQLKVWHPDRLGSDEALRKKGEEKTKLINRTFHQLREMVAHFEESGGVLDSERSLLIQCRHVELPFFRDEEPESIPVAEQRRNYRQESMVGLKKVKNEFGQIPVEDSLDILGENPKAKLLVGGLAAVTALLGTVALIGFVNLKDTNVLKRRTSSEHSSIILEEEVLKEREESKQEVSKSKVEENMIQGSKGSERMFSGIGGRQKESLPPIIAAASRCSKSGVKEQLSNGVGVDTEDDDGMTAISWAAKKNCSTLARYLISKGANEKHVSLNGFTPLDWARWFKNIEMVKILELDVRRIKMHSARKLSRKQY